MIVRGKKYTGRIGGVGGRWGGRRRVDVRRPSNMAPIGTKLGQNAFQTIPVNSIFGEQQKKSARCFGLGNRFSPFWAGFEASSEKRTSPSTSWQFFALDGPILSSVRPKIDKNMSVGALRSVMRRRPPHLSPTPPMRSAYSILACFSSSQYFKRG